MANNRTIPHDVILNILSRLPVKSLLRFRCVSKPWNISSTDPTFAKTHLNEANQTNKISLVFTTLEDPMLYFIDSINYKKLSVGKAVEIEYPPNPRKSSRLVINNTCDGLLCMNYYYEDDFVFLMNPSTREFKRLPPLAVKLPRDALSQIAYGFGYDLTIDDYKVVRLVCYYILGNSTVVVDLYQVHVYTLGSNKWRMISNRPNYKFHDRFPTPPVNGALHWLTINHAESINAVSIVAFDLAKEEFREMIPPLAAYQTTLDVLGGCLCLLHSASMSRVDFWMMKEYGVDDSWFKFFSIVSVRPLSALGLSDTGEVLVERAYKELVLYDPKDRKVRPLKLCGISRWEEAKTYVGSLVSLKSGTYVGRESIGVMTRSQSALANKRRKVRR